MNRSFARLHQVIDYLKDIGKIHKQQDIVDALGIAKSNLSMALKGNERYLTEGFLKRFAAAYSDYINEDWLLTGEGQMEVPDKTLRPHVGVKAAAGFMTGIADADAGNETLPKIPFIPDYDFTITADGDSMMPKIESGDILACRFADDRVNPPIGKICVIDSKDGAAVKVLKAANGSELTLHSLNPAYKDYPVPTSDINRIAVVVGMVSNMA